MNWVWQRPLGAIFLHVARSLLLRDRAAFERARDALIEPWISNVYIASHVCATITKDLLNNPTLPCTNALIKHARQIIEIVEASRRSEIPIDAKILKFVARK